MEGIEKIKILSSEIKDSALLKIIKYLLSRKDMNEKYLNEEKSLKQMVEFIKSLAKEKATNGIAMIEDEVVYGWAIHYWDESNKNLKLEKSLVYNKKPVKAENIVKRKTNKTVNWVAEGQLTLFDVH